MKTLTGCLMVLTLYSPGWAAFGSLPGDQTQPPDSSVSEHKHKKHKAAASATAGKAQPAITAAPAAQGAQALAVAAVKAVIPSNPLVNALDDIVLKEALAPAVSTGQAAPGTETSAQGSQALGARNPAPGASSPTLRAWAAGMLVQSTRLDVSLSAGLGTFRAGGQTDLAPEVALRVMPYDPSRWGWELGSLLPHRLSGGPAVNETEGATAYNADLWSYYEIHAAGIHSLPHGNQTWAVPEVGLGLSFVHARDDLHSQTPASYTFQSGGETYTQNYLIGQGATDERWSVSPLVRLGIVMFPQSLVSFRLDAAYVNYANTAKGLGQTFDLGLSGVMVEEMVQMRL